MIDTDKYEGHSEGEWYWSPEGLRCETHLVYPSQPYGPLWNGTPPHPPIDMRLITDAPLLLAEVKRLREESKKKGDVLTTLDEMIRNYASHVEMMKALEQGLDLPETWKEMIE